jgi:predicted patatin/cPLA2 family phospholipase
MLRRKKKVFVISPSEEIDIGRLERDTKRLGDVYYMGYKDTKRLMPRLKEYLNKGE